VKSKSEDFNDNARKTERKIPVVVFRPVRTVALTVG
jgi:hypothetical protein